MGQSVFSQLKRSTMRPFVAIAFILGSVYGAPSNLLPAGYAAGHLAAAPLAVAHAAPVAVAAAPAVSLPAPYSVDTQAEGRPPFTSPPLLSPSRCTMARPAT